MSEKNIDVYVYIYRSFYSEIWTTELIIVARTHIRQDTDRTVTKHTKKVISQNYDVSFT